VLAKLDQLEGDSEVQQIVDKATPAQANSSHKTQHMATFPVTHLQRIYLATECAVAYHSLKQQAVPADATICICPCSIDLNIHRAYSF